MTMITLKLLKDWENDGDTIDAGMLLQVDDDTADDLIEKGVAEKYDKAAADAKEATEKAEAKAAKLEARLEALEAKRFEKDGSEKDQREKAVKILGGEPNILKDPKGGFKSLNEMLVAVAAKARGDVQDDRLIMKTAGHMEEGDASQGGYLVAPEYRNELLKRVYDMGAVLSRCRQIPISSNTVVIPAINETSRATGSRHGGVTGKSTAEAAQKVATKPALRQIEMKVNKKTCLTYVSDELLDDSPQSVEAIITPLFTEELQWIQENEIVNGTGAGQALGYMNSPALITVLKEAGQAAATVVFENIVNMWARMYGKSMGNSAWFISQDILPQLMTMSIAVGVGGAAVYLPANTIAGVPYQTLMGRPVVPIEYCATLGTVGDIALCDMSQYLVATKGGMKSASSMHLRFDYNEMAFRWEIRFDGQP